MPPVLPLMGEALEPPVARLLDKYDLTYQQVERDWMPGQRSACRRRIPLALPIPLPAWRLHRGGVCPHYTRSGSPDGQLAELGAKNLAKVREQQVAGKKGSGQPAPEKP